ncbi:MAG TPA: xanthine dehydrogenase family protein subunit M [Candidatus Dormibacteraeota bacterium]|nr:xanthine dehydrogenase family protein subunit M [Candidatus Dormibacteraeota bacterium]
MRYLRPDDLDEALELLAEHGEAAKVLAGGQSLLVLMREHLVEPELLIGLSGIDALRRLEVNGEARIGAMVTHAQVERDRRIVDGWPILAQAEAAVSTVQIRNRGTLCGNVAHAFPTADPPAALIACDARIHLASKAGGERTVEAKDFFTGVMETVARADELITAVSLPPQPEGARGAYLKYAVRPLDFAIVGVAVRVVVSAGRIEDVRIGLNGAASRPLRAAEAEAVLVGQTPTRELLAEAAQTAARHSDPLDEVDGSAAYRRRCVAVHTRRALERALGMEGR